MTMPAELFQRFARLPAASPARALRLTTGSLRDYAALAEHHYRAGRPATATRVLVLRHDVPTPPQRFSGFGSGAGAGEVVGVLVESLPTLSCRLRDYALRDRFGSWLAGRPRAALLGRELRCISRVVIDPRWRGMGLASGLVREALATAQTPFTEALAAMGRVNPFFERAGMTPYHRPPHALDARLIAALAVVGLTPRDLAWMHRTRGRLDALPPHRRDWAYRELRRWRQNAFGRARSPGPPGSPGDSDIGDILLAARRRLLLPPIYYLHDNRAVAAPRQGTSP